MVPLHATLAFLLICSTTAEIFVVLCKDPSVACNSTTIHSLENLGAVVKDSLPFGVAIIESETKPSIEGVSIINDFNVVPSTLGQFSNAEAGLSLADVKAFAKDGDYQNNTVHEGEENDLVNYNAEQLSNTSGRHLTYFGKPVSNDDILLDYQWGHLAVGAQGAWSLGFRGAGVRVAVLDDGFDLQHPDLRDNINFELSKDFTGEGLQAVPLSNNLFSHGTAMAGIIAAPDNAFGMIGVAPEAELILVKVLKATDGSVSNIVKGIYYAASVGCDVMNLSLGGGINASGYKQKAGIRLQLNEIEKALKRAVQFAFLQGCLVVKSAGNEAQDLSARQNSQYVTMLEQTPHVLNIAAVSPYAWAMDPNASLTLPTSYSNTGSFVDFAAPGGDDVFYRTVTGKYACYITEDLPPIPCGLADKVLSTRVKGYSWIMGTSPAAAYASGVAALILSEVGRISPGDLRDQILARALAVGSGNGNQIYGSGVVNTGYT